MQLSSRNAARLVDAEFQKLLASISTFYTSMRSQEEKPNTQLFFEIVQISSPALGT